MKRFLLALLLTVLGAQAQPLLRNPFTTNTTANATQFSVSGTTVSIATGPIVTNLSDTGTLKTDRLAITNYTLNLLTDTLFPVAFKAGDPSVRAGGGLTMTGTNVLAKGDLGLNNRTNLLSVSAAGLLLLDGVPIATAGDTTNTYNTIITTNLTVLNNLYTSNFFATNVTVQTITSITNIYNVGQGGKLTITTNLTIVTNAVLTLANLPRPSVLVLGTNSAVANATLSGLTLDDNNNLTATGGGGGASVWMPNTALDYAGGTNLTIDGSGGTNFTVVLTNTAFFGTPSNIAASKSTNTTFTVFFQQDSTGGRLVTWTNASFFFPGNVAFQPLTNASRMSSVTFIMSPFTNSVFLGDYGVFY